MIRCSAFCLTSDEKDESRARGAAKTIDRASDGRPAEEDVGQARVLALPLGSGRGLPVVHGWVNSDLKDGEFSMLIKDGDRLLASRDAAGTRPLYVAKSGRWVSTDHRFLPRQDAQLIPPGSVYDFATQRIANGKTASGSFGGSFEEAGRELAGILQRVVQERVSGAGMVAVAFSGGLDSSILLHCAKKHASVVGCAVHAPASLDSRTAPRAAELLGVELLQEEATGRKLKQELASLDLPFEPSTMDRSLWCIYSMASRLASEAGARLIVLGQLADELFGGYRKYERALVEQGERAAAALMTGDVAACGTHGFLRDEAACSRWLDPRFPFADARVLELGEKLPVGFKIRRGVRKAVLREAALELGVPVELVATPKKAAQYSSGIQRIIG